MMILSKRNGYDHGARLAMNRFDLKDDPENAESGWLYHRI
jgi:hypothetical protein